MCQVYEIGAESWGLDIVLCFFFQAEDGIRDYKVTGVQTCALPIYSMYTLVIIRTSHVFFRQTREYNIRQKI